ncbi:MAG: DsbA family protein [Solirubrobacteraceae bacterium]
MSERSRLPLHLVDGEAEPSPSSPVFCFDLRSPLCYLAAERALHAFGGRIAWQPVDLTLLPGADRFEAFRCAAEEAAFREDVERRARALALQPLRWPEPFPFDSTPAMLAATYAKGIGRGAAFALAAFRQAFAGGHALEREDFVLIAAAACEMHPQAVRTAIAGARTARQLEQATRSALAAGAVELPAFLLGGEAFVGERALERAAARSGAATAPATARDARAPAVADGATAPTAAPAG